MPSEAVNWRDVWAIVLYAEANSPIRLALSSEPTWDAPTYILADVADSLRWLVWSKTKDGANGRNRPEPIPRPGMKHGRGETRPADVLSVEEAKQLL